MWLNGTKSLDDKSVCSVSSLRVKFNVDFSFSEFGRLYSIKLKKDKHIDKENIEKSWKKFMRGTLKIPGPLQRIFNVDSEIEVVIPAHSLQKKNRVNG